MTKALSHSSIILVGMVLLWLLFGAAVSGSAEAVSGLAMFGAVTTISYAVFVRIVGGTASIDRRLNFSAKSWQETALWLLAIMTIAISIVHYVQFSGFTLPQALVLSDNIEVALLRQRATDNLPGWMRYATSFASRTLFPLLPVFALMHGRPKLAALVLGFGLLYAICTMMKANAVLVILPTALYLLLSRKVISTIAFSATAVAAVLLMALIANPSSRPGFLRVFESTPQIMAFSVTGEVPEGRGAMTFEAPDASDGKLARSLAHRVLIAPGEVVAIWFSLIPREIPFADGCAYRVLTRMLQCDFVPVDRMIYDRVFPKEAAQGLEGTVNAASMMVAYANFGWAGLIGSGVLHGLLAAVLYAIFASNPPASVYVNLPYIFLLSSGDLFTMLLSGGWALAIALYLLLGRERKRQGSLTLPQ